MAENFEVSGIESANNVNSLSEASEQDIVRVSENMQKAKTMGSQIADDSKKNSQIAQFLTYLLGAVSSEEIRATSVELFSKIDPATNTTSLMIHEMIALYLPFHIHKAHDLGVFSAFPWVKYEISLAQDNYIDYIKELYHHYPIYKELDKDTLSLLVTSLLLYHNVVILEEGKTVEEIAQQIRIKLLS